MFYQKNTEGKALHTITYNFFLPLQQMLFPLGTFHVYLVGLVKQTSHR